MDAYAPYPVVLGLFAGLGCSLHEGQLRLDPPHALARGATVFAGICYFGYAWYAVLLVWLVGRAVEYGLEQVATIGSFLPSLAIMSAQIVKEASKSIGLAIWLRVLRAWHSAKGKPSTLGVAPVGRRLMLARGEHSATVGRVRALWEILEDRSNELKHRLGEKAEAFLAENGLGQQTTFLCIAVWAYTEADGSQTYLPTWIRDCALFLVFQLRPGSLFAALAAKLQEHVELAKLGPKIQAGDNLRGNLEQVIAALDDALTKIPVVRPQVNMRANPTFAPVPMARPVASFLRRRLSVARAIDPSSLRATDSLRPAVQRRPTSTSTPTATGRPSIISSKTPVAPSTQEVEAPSVAPFVPMFPKLTAPASAGNSSGEETSDATSVLAAVDAPQPAAGPIVISHVPVVSPAVAERETAPVAPACETEPMEYELTGPPVTYVEKRCLDTAEEVETCQEIGMAVAEIPPSQHSGGPSFGSNSHSLELPGALDGQKYVGESKPESRVTEAPAEDVMMMDFEPEVVVGLQPLSMALLHIEDDEATAHQAPPPKPAPASAEDELAVEMDVDDVKEFPP